MKALTLEVNVLNSIVLIGNLLLPPDESGILKLIRENPSVVHL